MALIRRQSGSEHQYLRCRFCWIESALSAGTELMIPTRALLLHKLLRSGWCVALAAMAIATLVEWGLMAEQTL